MGSRGEFPLVEAILGPEQSVTRSITLRSKSAGPRCWPGYRNRSHPGARDRGALFQDQQVPINILVQAAKSRAGVYVPPVGEACEGSAMYKRPSLIVLLVGVSSVGVALAKAWSFVGG